MPARMDEESEPFILDSKAESAGLNRRKRSFLSSQDARLPWCLVAALSIYALISGTLKTSSVQLWTSTDFTSARPALHTTTTQFTSSIDFIDPEHIFRVYDPSKPVYVGNASAENPEIDQNWDDMILPADIYITDEEASTLQVDASLYRNPKTGLYKIELEVFHSLHCLNMIRMRVYADHYPQMLTENAIIHVDHCIESLRELIMCEGNMTPIPIEWSEKGERINPNYAQKHSCRDFDSLKEWTKHRVEMLP